MLKYLIIQLDDASTSFCQYENDRMRSRLIPLETLKEAIFWSMKENLSLQFLYPDYEIPEEYKKAIEPTFHADIVSSTCEDEDLRANADVVVFDSFAGINYYPFIKKQAYAFRTTFAELFDNAALLHSILSKVDRINIILTDQENLSQQNEAKYTEFLNSLANKITEEYKSGHSIQVNILTDRMLLDGMNNCNAGVESISLCPDGNFYICPGFYADGSDGYSVGNLESGLNLRNPQLYELNYAPICRVCDAFQCRRCVWQNRKSTLEVNTPGHEQCVIAHLERNASRNLLEKIRKIGQFLPEKEITKIDYLDPFEKILDD